MVALGDWIVEDSYAVLEEGKPRIERWASEKCPSDAP
jgi:hypothetical protein